MTSAIAKMNERLMNDSNNERRKNEWRHIASEQYELVPVDMRL